MTEKSACVSSMTGFARTDGGAASTAQDGAATDWSWSWEIRSVNSKGLDLRMRLPSVAEAWEQQVRARVGAVLHRGSVTVNWSLERADRATAPDLVVNEAFLELVLGLQQRLEDKGLVFPTAPSLDRLLAVRGVVETVERVADAAVIEQLAPTALGDLDAALLSLVDARRREGDRLHTFLLGHLDEIDALTAAAAKVAEAQPAALRKRLQDQLAMLLQASPPVSEERLAQEIALLATKADVREETDRLTAHVGACRDLLKAGGAVGRKLDFICQELNREANTLCSKAVDLDLTNIGVELKTRIERFREQVQNVE
ncbi:MAG: YicC family protein [Alphaproteobacteria bacterium]|nr:YicC family protein [Alphaproteobacteria bacterium]